MGISYTAALGFALLAAKNSGFEACQVLDLYANMSRAFQVKTEREAETVLETYIGVCENSVD